MPKSLEEINHEFQQSIQIKKRDGPEKKQHSRKVGTLLSNMIFYGAILILVLTAAVYTLGDGENPLMGYRIFHVLTDSMDGVYPKGTLLLTRQEDEIQEGDDITFLMSQSMTVTHRVIEVLDNYDGEGNRGYRTQGVANSQPDAEVTHEYNVLGKVVWSLPLAGFILQYLTDNLWLTVAVFVLCMLVSFALRIFLDERRRAKRETATTIYI